MAGRGVSLASVVALLAACGGSTGPGDAQTTSASGAGGAATTASGGAGGAATATTGQGTGGTAAAGGTTGSGGASGGAGGAGGAPADCGNGVIEAGETCDDGDHVAGDGCTACVVDTGYGCDGEPSKCHAICGDGLLVGSELCDDGNTKDGDGCGASCSKVEKGWKCSGGAPTVCTAVCGDGSQVGPETCDDFNKKGGDGCSASCEVEPGYACKGSPSKCAPVCGDGVVGPGEACDDGNTQGGDGCSADCTAVEAGWSCGGAPKSVCAAICGDGLVVGPEACDDGNQLGGDLCAADCLTGVQALFHDALESGPGGWAHAVVSGGAPDTWQLSGARSTSPTTSWYSGPAAGQGGDTRLTSPMIDLTKAPAGKKVSLAFDHWYAFDDCNGQLDFDPDGAFVEVSVDGAPFQEVTIDGGYPSSIDVGACSNPQAGAPAFTRGSGGGFRHDTVDLTAFAGHVIRVGFHVAWDCGNCAVTEGWYLDEVLVSVAP